MNSAETRNYWAYIRWPIFTVYLILVAAGLILLAFDLSEGLKYFISGALVGVGGGGVLGELAATPERRVAEQRYAQAQQSALADCRHAYAMGDFWFAFYARLSKGEQDDPHVKLFLLLSDRLGMHDTVQSLIDQSPHIDAGDVLGALTAAFTFQPEYVEAFYKLGSDLYAVRGNDAKTNPEARNVVLDRICENLHKVRDLTTDAPVQDAVQRAAKLWQDEALSGDEVDSFFAASATYLRKIGTSEPEAEAARDVLRDFVHRH